MRGTRHLRTPYCYVWDDKILRKICPVEASLLSHIPSICLSIPIKWLILILFQVLREWRGRIMPSINGSQMRSVIFCNLFHHIDGDSLGIIITWSSGSLLWITISNNYIYMTPETRGGLNMKKTCFMVTGIFYPSYLLKNLVITWPFLNQYSRIRGTLSPRTHQYFIFFIRLYDHYKYLRCRGTKYIISYPDMKYPVISPIKTPYGPCTIMLIPETWMTCILKFTSI